MGHSTRLTADQEEYLKQNHLTTTYAEMSRHIGVHHDTLKRILVRMGLQEFNGAKYHATIVLKKWKRPCIRCKCTKERPANQYICVECKQIVDYEDSSAVDFSGSDEASLYSIRPSTASIYVSIMQEHQLKNNDELNVSSVKNENGRLKTNARRNPYRYARYHNG